MDIVIVEH